MAMSIRESFVQRFGEEEAERVERAAMLHDAVTPGIKISRIDGGGEWFATCFMTGVAFGCYEKDSNRQTHGFTTSLLDLHAWAIEANVVEQMDRLDVIAALAGVFDGWTDK